MWLCISKSLQTCQNWWTHTHYRTDICSEEMQREPHFNPTPTCGAFGFVSVVSSSFFPTTTSAHGSVLCNMPDGRDQEIRHWGEHMRLAHYPSRSPSSTLHTRLHMLRTASHFSATAVIMSHTRSHFLLFSARLSLSEINAFTFLTNSVSYLLLPLNAQM